MPGPSRAGAAASLSGLHRHCVFSCVQRLDGVLTNRGAVAGLPDGIRRPGEPPRFPELRLDRLGERATPVPCRTTLGPGRSLSEPKSDSGHLRYRPPLLATCPADVP